MRWKIKTQTFKSAKKLIVTFHVVVEHVGQVPPSLELLLQKITLLSEKLVGPL